MSLTARGGRRQRARANRLCDFACSQQAGQDGDKPSYKKAKLGLENTMYFNEEVRGSALGSTPWAKQRVPASLA
jgi:hypothetical protein